MNLLNFICAVSILMSNSQNKAGELYFVVAALESFFQHAAQGRIFVRRHDIPADKEGNPEIVPHGEIQSVWALVDPVHLCEDTFAGLWSVSCRSVIITLIAEGPQ